MHRILRKIANHNYDHPWRMLIFLAMIIAVVAYATTANMKQPTSAVTIPNTEAYHGIERKNELFPETGKGAARIVVVAPVGKTLGQYQGQITNMTDEMNQIQGVNQAVNPFDNQFGMSADQRTAYIQVQLANGTGALDAKTIDGINAIAERNRVNGLQVEQDGDVINSMPHSIIGQGEIISIAVALVVLLITFAAVVAAGLPILIALLSVGLSMAGLFGLSQIVEINSVTPALAVMLGLAVGIDYSLLIITRYRAYLLEGMPLREAVSKATQTAGSAVLFAAATVCIALAALSVVSIPFMTVMGLSGAATVAVAAVMAVAYLPVLLRLTGMRVLSKKAQRAAAKARTEKPVANVKINKQQVWYRWGALVTRRPVIFMIMGLVVVGLMALPIGSMSLGLPSDQYAAETTTQRKAYDAVTQAFGVGYNAPLVVVVEGMKPVSAAEKQAAMTQLLQQSEAARSGVMPADMASQAAKYTERLHLQAIADKISLVDNVQQVIPAQVSADGTSGLLQIIPGSAPYDAATSALIQSLRDPSTQSAWATAGTTFMITGSTAMQIDTNAKLAAAVPVYLLVVAGLSLVLLIVAFRSVIIPIKATLGYILSVSAMMGVLVAAFQWGWFGITDAPGPIVSFIPIIGSGVLFGLAMDYEFFLVSNMSEEFVRTRRAKQSVINGFALGGKVVTAAAVIMVSVFAGFISNENSTVQALGFALAIGILVDAFIVRMMLVPATMSLVGKHAWWVPRWLGKVLPKAVFREN